MDSLKEQQYVESKEKLILVIHTQGSSKTPDYKGKPWIDYWKESSGKGLPDKCPCCNKPLSKEKIWVGAHVEIFAEYAETNKTIYITPTCNECNSKYQGKIADKEPFKVEEGMLVPMPTDA